MAPIQSAGKQYVVYAAILVVLLCRPHVGKTRIACTSTLFYTRTSWSTPFYIGNAVALVMILDWPDTLLRIKSMTHEEFTLRNSHGSDYVVKWESCQSLLKGNTLLLPI